MSGGEIAALIASGAFAMLVLVLCVPIYRLRHTVDAATKAIDELNARSGPLLGNMNTTVENVNMALSQVHQSLDGVNLQLMRVDTITSHAAQVSANVANLTAIVSAAASNPLVKVAAFGYGVRRATNIRKHAEDEKAVRSQLRERQRQEKAEARARRARRG